MPGNSMRWWLVTTSTIAVVAVVFSALLLYRNWAEFSDLPALAYTNRNYLINPTGNRMQDFENGRLALSEYWADNLVKDKAYTATIETDRTEILTDGNSVHTHQAVKFARDRDGRLRLDQPIVISAWSGIPGHFVRVLIDDPIANRSYIFVQKNGSSQFDSARQKDFLAQFAYAKGAALLSLPPLDEKQGIRRTGLGVKEIEGLPCRGMREVDTIPAGNIGNDRPIVIYSEIWFAPAIEAVVQSTVTDPRIGRIDYRLTGVKLTDSPTDLFRDPRSTMEP